MKTIRKTLLSAAYVVCAVLVSVGAMAQTGISAGEKFVLVIDPGHGGDQPGAVYGGVQEKDLNLALALKFGQTVARDMPDVQVLYTRTGDTNPSLAARGTMANKAGADLFVSIHINAHTDRSASGTSTWVMGAEKSEKNLQEAMRENEVIRYEPDASESYAGFDPSSPESYVIFQLMQSAHFDRSIQFARTVQKYFARGTSMRDRGAEQGPFLVLWKAAMPAVLVEAGFLSNDADRAYLSTVNGQDNVARSLYDAFREYKSAITASAEQLRGSITVTSVSSTGGGSVPPATTRSYDMSAYDIPSYDTSSYDMPSYDMPSYDDSYFDQTDSYGQTGGYYVQLAATSTPISTHDDRFGEYRGRVVQRVTGGLYKYMLGPYYSQNEAVWERDDARRKGFPDAFLVRP